MGKRTEPTSNMDKMGEGIAELVVESIKETIYADNALEQLKKGLISSTAEGMGEYYQRVLRRGNG